MKRNIDIGVSLKITGGKIGIVWKQDNLVSFNCYGRSWNTRTICNVLLSTLTGKDSDGNLTYAEPEVMAKGLIVKHAKDVNSLKLAMRYSLQAAVKETKFVSKAARTKLWEQVINGTANMVGTEEERFPRDENNCIL